MDPQFQELAAEITRNVTRDVTEAVTRNVTEAVKRDVTEVVSAAERRLTTHVQVTLDKAERRLAEQARVNVEAVKAEFRLSAEAFAGVLRPIDARRARIETRLDRSTEFLTSLIQA